MPNCQTNTTHGGGQDKGGGGTNDPDTQLLFGLGHGSASTSTPPFSLLAKLLSSRVGWVISSDYPSNS